MAAEVLAVSALLPSLRAQDDPGGLCVADERRRLSNRVFAAAVDAMAGRLAAHGIGFGDTVGTLLPNSVDLVVTVFAAWRLGAVLTPVDSNLSQEAAVHQLQDAGAQVLVAAAAQSSAAAYAGARLIERSLVLAAPAAPAQLPPVVTAPNDFAVALYSRPRGGEAALGVLLDHRNLTTAAEALVERLELGGTDTSLLLLPMWSADGLTAGALAPLVAGGHLALVDLATPHDVLYEAGRHDATFFCADAPLCRRLATSTQGQGAPRSLRFVACTYETLGDEVRQRLEERLGVAVLQGWGLTEAAGAVTLESPRRDRRPGSAGPALCGYEVRVLGPQDEIVPAGAVGAVVVRGRSVMRGYLGRRVQTAELLREGWLRTGVAGYLGVHGQLVLMGRLDDALLRGEQHVHPREVEVVLCAHGDVLDARVTGRPDAVLGQVAVAEVVLRAGTSLSVDDLMAHCRKNLERYKVPDSVRVVAALSHELAQGSATIDLTALDVPAGRHG